MPSQTFRASAPTDAPMEHAWDSLHDHATWEGVAGVEEVTGARYDSAGRLTSFSFTATVAGIRYPGTATVTQATAPEHMRLDLTTSELTATLDVRLATTDPHTSVQIDLTVQTRSFLAGMFFPAVADSIGRNLPATTNRFAQRLARPT